MSSGRSFTASVVVSALFWACASLLASTPAEETRPGAAIKAPGEATVESTMSRAEWKRQLRQWLEVLRRAHEKTGEPAEELRERIRAIRDPEAMEGLQAVLADGGDYPRIVFLEPVAKIGGPKAIKTLVEVSVKDTNVSVAKEAARLLSQMENRKEAIPEYVKFLRTNRYSARAAEALSASGLTRQVSVSEVPDPHLTNSLINALVGTETRLVPVDTWRLRVYRKPSGGGYHGDSERRYVRVGFPVPAPSVLEALREYTAEDYGYDQGAWRKWYETRKNVSRERN